MSAYMPTSDLLDGIRRAFALQLFPWDDYFARMAETDFLAGKAEVPAAKSYFVRRAPFGGSYTLLGGITAALRLIKDLPLDDSEFSEGMLYRGYRPSFVDYLKKLGRLKDVTVYAAPEGTPFFPNEPIVSVTGPLAQLRLVDGLLISELNFPSLALTKWNRMVRVVRPGGVMEFSRRRSQDTMRSSLYGMLAGCIATSNSELCRFFDFQLRGTMGHEGPQSRPTIQEYFDAWLTHQPHLPIGLVDTIKCMEVDFPAWLDACYRHRDAIKAANPPVWGWRDDSDDLAYLAIEQYIQFFRHPLSQDPWFVERMRNWLTNELDEYTAGEIISQIRKEGGAAGHDAEDIIRRIIWAAGTKPGVCADDPAINGVMKLMEAEGLACIKLALDAEGHFGLKTSIPGANLSGMVRNGTDNLGILIYPGRYYHITPDGQLFDRRKNRGVEVLETCHPDNEALVHQLKTYTIEPRQQIVFEHGDFTEAWQKDRPTIQSVPKRAMGETDKLPWRTTRIKNPQVFPVSVTADLHRLRRHMIRSGLLQSEYLGF